MYNQETDDILKQNDFRNPQMEADNKDFEVKDDPKDDTNDFNGPDDGPASLYNERKSWNEFVPGSTERKLVVTVDGRVVEENVTTPPKVIEHDELFGEKTLPNFEDYGNKEDNKDYLKRLQDLLNAYNNYQELLKEFGKTVIKEVLEEAKRMNAFDGDISQYEADNFDGSMKL